MPSTPNKLSLNFTKNNYSVFGTRTSNNDNVEQQSEQKAELLEGEKIL